MEENNNKRKRTIRDISHLFLSSMEEKRETPGVLSSSKTFDSYAEPTNSVKASQEISKEPQTSEIKGKKNPFLQDSFRFIPLLKIVSIFPIIAPF